MTREEFIATLSKQDLFPVRRCFLCREYIGYRWHEERPEVVFSGACGCSTDEHRPVTWAEIDDFLATMPPEKEEE